MADFQTKKRLMKITPESVAEVLRNNKGGRVNSMTENQILKDLGVYPDPDKITDQEVDQYEHVVDTLANKVRSCCQQSEHVERGQGMWDAFVYVPDSVLEERREEERRLQQKQQRFDDAVESNPDLTEGDDGFYTYKDEIRVNLEMNGEQVYITCAELELAAGGWILYNVDDVFTLLDGLVEFAEATNDIDFDTYRITMTA